MNIIDSAMPANNEHEQATLNSLAQYDTCRLECDGLTRVLAYILTKEIIEHTVMIGEIIDEQTQKGFSPHFWIALPDGRYIDYRARMWLGQAEHVPHGIFNPADYPVAYDGEPIAFENLEQIALLLLQLECGDAQ
jgi:hypothetical protein